MPSFSVLPRLHSKDKVFLGFAEPSLWRHSVGNLFSAILLYTEKPQHLCMFTATLHICRRDYVSVWMAGEGQ